MGLLVMGRFFGMSDQDDSRGLGLADSHSGMFVTVFYGVLDPTEGTLTYSNAGQPPPLLATGDSGAALQRLVTCGPPLGVLEDGGWTSAHAALPPGSVLALYTDGVLEAHNASGDLYGMERLTASLLAHVGLPPLAIEEAILADVARFAAGTPRQDDIAVVIVARDPR